MDANWTVLPRPALRSNIKTFFKSLVRTSAGSRQHTFSFQAHLPPNHVIHSGLSDHVTNGAHHRASVTSAANRFGGIHNTLMHRIAVLAAVQILGRIRHHEGCVLMLSKRLCVKHGSLVPIWEASTLQFVGERTSIPVPKVYCAFIHRGITYILMDRIKGHKLGSRWHSRSEESKRKILDQLQNFIRQLRSIPPPSPAISNVNGGPLYDVRFPGSSLTVGPFETTADFHRFLRNDLQAHPDNRPDINRMIFLQDRPWPMPVLTHGDLSSLNILLRGDDVVGIVDWETSGWYPSYWEHSTAWNVNPQNKFWRDEVGKFLYSTAEEREMEHIRRLHFSDV